MRIAHVVDYFHTDVGYQEFYLAKAHAEAGHDVRVVTSVHRHGALQRSGADERLGADALAQAGVEVVRLPARQLGHDRAWLQGLRPSVAAFRPDALHCHTAFGPTTVRSAHIRHRLAVPLLVDSHLQETGAPASARPLNRAAYRAYRRLFGSYLRRTVGDWVTDAPEKKDFLVTRLAIPPVRVGIVPLGFDPAVFFFDKDRRRATRAERGWDNDVVVAVTGKLGPNKKVEWAARACERAWPHRSVRLVLAGDIDPDYLGAVELAAPGLSKAGRLDHLPMLGRHELADLYRASDVVMFPHLTSISIFEAAGTGVATVLPKDAFGVFHARLHRGFRLGDPSELHQLLEPIDDRSTLADEAEAAFSWRVIASEFVRRYEAIR